jgi:sugar phosphate isomerase/epimerase
MTPASVHLQRIGIQLYTLRTLMDKDLEGTLAKVADIGYNEVEFAGYFGRTPKQIRALLLSNRLTSPSSHIPLPANNDAWSRALDDAREIGHEWAVIPWLDDTMRKADDWPRHADRFNQLAAKARDAGMRFAYHNHDFEFMKIGDGTGLDVLLSKTDPALVDFEMDLYWVTKAGADPLDLISRYPKRFKLMHAKDATAAPERAMAPVGQGTIDFAKIFERERTSGMQHVYVEHDQPADPIQSATASYQYLAALKY